MPLVRFETVTVTGVAAAVVMIFVPPTPVTVTVAVRLIVHVEVFPEDGAPKVTDGLAPVVPPVAVVAFAPGVYVHAYVLVYGSEVSLGAAEPFRTIGRPEPRVAPGAGDTIFTVIGNGHMEVGSPKNCVSTVALNRFHVLLTNGAHLNSVSVSV